MASKSFILTRLALQASYLSRSFNFSKNSLIYHLTKFKTNSRNKKVQPLLFAFLSLPFTSKKEKLPTMTDELKIQYEKADSLFDENKFQETFDYLNSLSEQQNNAEVLWRKGRTLFKVAGSESDTKKKDELIRESFKYLSESLELDDKNFATHKWYAILLDAKSNLDGIKERIQQLETVKRHMQRAIELNPKDPTSRYILGEFAFGLADLPWYQRKIVSTIFATPPTGTYEEALDCFLTAESLEEGFYSMNLLMIGKCYYELKNNDKAKVYLTKASNITPANEDDRKCKEDAEKLLSKLK